MLKISQHLKLFRQIKFNKPLKSNENTISNIPVKDSNGNKLDMSLKLKKDTNLIKNQIVKDTEKIEDNQKYTKEISVFKNVEGDLQTVNSINNKIYYISTEQNPFYRDFVLFESSNINRYAYFENLYEMNPHDWNKVRLIRGCDNFIATENYIFYNNELDDQKLYRYDFKNGKTQKYKISIYIILILLIIIYTDYLKKCS